MDFLVVHNYRQQKEKTKRIRLRNTNRRQSQKPNEAIKISMESITG